MAKRRAEDTLLHGSPSKRCHRSLLESAPPAAVGGVSMSPPSLLALLGSRCKKRPHYFEDPEQEEEEEAAAGLYRRTTHCDTRKHAADVVTTQTSGSFQERHDPSATTSHKKRPREDCVDSETAPPQATDPAADGDTNTEDCAFNSFQYWRPPLPELDLSLLDSNSQTEQKSKVKDAPSDVMET
ncbi:uncharacterized protein wu:fa19b12 [Scophthalmus maximus]|uniref:uncharacterized protein wu:fa19b12 n=1 Tax=Scophthalmus maximus TaxID=52904 RepID=UPI0015E14C25|nr:uncharacterized protein wu:fa19b12 [Scophthalmus maximus]